MTLKIESFLILILVWLYPNFANSYDLIRIMNRCFDMFEVGDNYSFLEDNLYLESIEIEKIHHYKITEKGKRVIIQNIDGILSESRMKFTEHADFLESILSKLQNHIKESNL